VISMQDSLAGLSVRRMVEADIPAVTAIDHISFSLPWPESSYRFELEHNPNSRCWVAVLKNEIAGILVLWKVLDEAHIGTLATHPDFRQRGVGRILLSRALLEAREEGCTTSFLEVRNTNLAAQALYNQFGYEITGRRPHYYHDTHEDALLMTLTPIPEDLSGLAGIGKEPQPMENYGS
jgi:ribosomal-protein-alanine N-acetyltransferase